MSEVDLSPLPDSLRTVFGDIPLIANQSQEVQDAMREARERRVDEIKSTVANGEKIEWSRFPIALQEKGPVFVEPQEAMTISAESVVPYCTPNDRKYLEDKRIDPAQMTIVYPSLATPPNNQHSVAIIDREGVRALQEGYTSLEKYFGPKGEIDSPDVLINSKAKNPDKQQADKARIWQRNAIVLNETQDVMAALEYMIIVPPEHTDDKSPIVVLSSLVRVEDEYKGKGARQIITGSMVSDATQLGKKLGIKDREVLLLGEIEPLSIFEEQAHNHLNGHDQKPDKDILCRLKAFQKSGRSMVCIERDGVPVPYYSQPELRPKEEWTDGSPKLINLALILLRYNTKTKEYIFNNSIPKGELLSGVYALREVYNRSVDPDAMKQYDAMISRLEEMVQNVEDVPLSYDFATPKV